MSKKHGETMLMELNQNYNLCVLIPKVANSHININLDAVEKNTL